MFKMPDLCLENVTDFLTIRDCRLAQLPYKTVIETIANKLTKKANFDYLPIIAGMDAISDVPAISQGQYIKDKVKEFFAQDNQEMNYKISDLRVLSYLIERLDEEKHANVIRGYYYGADSKAQHETFMIIFSLFKISSLLVKFLMEFAKFLNLNINAKNIFNVTVLDALYHRVNKSRKEDIGSLKLLLSHGADKNYLPIGGRATLEKLIVDEEKECVADKPLVLNG